MCEAYEVLCEAYEVLCEAYEVLCEAYKVLCEAYEVGWDFVIAPEQQQQQRSQPHQNHAASHTGEGSSCTPLYHSIGFRGHVL